MVREIRIYIEGIGDESEDESKIENISQKRPGFRSKIQPGKEATAGLRAVLFMSSKNSTSSQIAKALKFCQSPLVLAAMLARIS